MCTGVPAETVAALLDHCGNSVSGYGHFALSLRERFEIRTPRRWNFQRCRDGSTHDCVRERPGKEPLEGNEESGSDA